MARIAKFGIISILLLMMTFSTSSMLGVDQVTCGPDDPVFSINLLSPNNNRERNYWAALMESEFPKGCIGVEDHLSTDWTTIAARTWAYGSGLDFPPSYVDGGFDVLAVGYSNPDAPVVTYMDLYATGQVWRSNNNFIYYSNATFDGLRLQYINTLNASARDPFAYQMQEILYQDQPSLTVIYGANLWVFVDALSQSMGEDLLLGFSTTSFSDPWKDVGAGSGLTNLVYAHSNNLNEFVPQVANSSIPNLYTNAIWQGAYARDLNTKNYIPVLVDSLPVYSEDHIRANVTFNFGPDLTFADGHQVDMEDVEESFKRIFDPNYNDSSYANYVYYFGNPNNQSEFDYRPFDQMYTVIDDYTIEFNLTEPYFLATGLLSFPILPTHTWGPADSPTVADYDYNSYIRENPTSDIAMGTGPFRYASINGTSDNIQLQRNANYWNATTTSVSGPETLSFEYYDQKASALSDFDNGLIHMIDAQMDISFSEIESLTISNDYIITSDFSWQEIAINQLHPIIGTGAMTPLGIEDPSRADEAARYIRQAMSHLIPRQAIINEIYNGLGLPGITAWVEGTQHFNPNLEPYEHDIQRAKELLAMAGYDTHIDPTENTLDDSSPNIFNLGLTYSTFIIISAVPIITFYVTRKIKTIKPEK